MIYKKPANVSYCDMARWIDENAYREDVDDDKLFEYLYHIFSMLAYKAKMFKKYYLYEDFSFFAATRVFLRYKSKRQYEIGADGEPLVPKIKSSLNYCKYCLTPIKIDFEQREYAQIYSPPDKEIATDFSLTLENRIYETVEQLSRVEFSCCLHDVAKSCKYFLKKIPYASDKVVWNNIYLSCMLTLINSLIFPKDAYIPDLVNPEKLYKVYRKNRRDSVILYHLDDEMEGYICVLVNELRHVLANDISSILNETIPAVSLDQSVLLSGFDKLDAGEIQDGLE